MKVKILIKVCANWMFMVGVLVFGTQFGAFAKDQSSTLVYCTPYSPEHFAPALTNKTQTIEAAAYTIYDRLVEIDPKSGKIEAGLAEKWDVSPDGKTITVTLRKNVGFHSLGDFKPSRPMNADDVLFTILRQSDPKHPYHGISEGTYYSFDSSGLKDTLEKVEKKDDQTVVFQLKKPDAQFLNMLGMPFMSIVSAEYADFLSKSNKMGQLDTLPVGTGPFVFSDFKKDAAVRYVRNDQYWKGPSSIKTLIFNVTQDPAVRAAKVEKGECHVAGYLNKEDLDHLAQSKNVKLLSKDGLNVVFAAFNTQKKPFDNLKIREALTLAINKPELVKVIYKDKGTLAVNPFPAQVLGYNNDIVDHKQDVEKAKKLLAEAGYPDGFEFDLWVSNILPEFPQVAEILQSDWKKIGVNAKITNLEWGEFLKGAMKGEHPALVLRLSSDTGDPDDFITPYLGCNALKTGNNMTKWCNPQLDSILTEARQTLDTKKRADLYQKAQVIIHQQMPWIPIAHQKNTVVLSNNVEGFVMSPKGANMFYTVKLKE